MARVGVLLSAVTIALVLETVLSVDVTALTCNDDKTIDLAVSIDAEGYYVSIVGCAEEQQISSQTATLSNCSLIWGISYVLQIYQSPNVYMDSDFATSFSCNGRITNITSSFTYRSFRPTQGVDPTDGTVTDIVTPIVTMTITTDSAGLTTAGTVAVGTTLYLNLDLQSDFITSDGFDIRARKITVQSGDTVVTLTGDDMGGDGCLAQTYWGEVSDLGQGQLQIEFNAFMIVTGTTGLNSQTYTAYIEVCSGTACTAYTCSRKKRAAGFDEDFTELTDTVDDIEASLELVVVRLPLEDEDISNGGREESVNAGDTVCIQRTSFYGISIVLLIALMVCMAVTCIMFFRIRVHKR